MAAQEIRVPDIGDFTDVPIIEIHVAAGDTVAAEDPLLTLETRQGHPGRARRRWPGRSPRWRSRSATRCREGTVIAHRRGRRRGRRAGRRRSRSPASPRAAAGGRIAGDGGRAGGRS